MVVDCYDTQVPVDMAEYYVLENDNQKVKEWIVNNYLVFVTNAINDLVKPPRKPISKELVFALIYQESRGNPYAYRYEPSFFDWLSKRITPDQAVKGIRQYVSRKTEMVGRSTSFGPMQILGQTAREMGFKGAFLTELCNPEEGIYYSTKYLFSRVALYPEQDKHIAAFNSGTPKYNDYKGVQTLVNLPYVTAVKQHMKEFKEILKDEK